MNNINTHKLIIILFVFITVKLQAQLNSLEKQIQNVATPEVSNMMKYIDFPENDYIGKTNISIPLYTVNFGKLTIPLNLSYNTKGNKVADIATSVGLGWSLNAGGNLTVKVNDMNDLTETFSYYSQGGFEAEQTFAWHRQTKGFLTKIDPQVDNMCFTNRIWENDDVVIDSAPDFYYLNAPGLNDKFYFTKISDTQLKANFFKSKAQLSNTPSFTTRTGCNAFGSDQFGSQGKANVFYQIDKFEIIGENGYIYTFDDAEPSIITEYPFTFFSHNSLQVNNWYLTKIKDPYSGKEITFEYEAFANPYEHASLITYGALDFGDYPVAKNIELGTMISNFVYPYIYNRVVTSTLAPRRIKKIKTDKETIQFTYGHARLDYPGNGLTDILIKNENGSIIKQANLNYTYFESTNCTSGDYECKRLKLNSIFDTTLGTYHFLYDNNVFPPRNSSKVDFLGYYNNNNSNITFSKTDFHENQNGYYPGSQVYFYPNLPKDQILPFPLTTVSSHKITVGIDRKPNTNSKLGLLQKIIYPTGGALELTYEADDFMYEGAQYFLGSTRIKNMKFLDSQDILSKEVNFKYKNEDNRSSGQINFFTTPANSAKTEIASGIGFNTGAIIGYSRVVEETVGKGFIERKYTNFNDYPDKLMKSNHNFTDQSTLNFLKFLKFPYSYVQSFDERRGKLIAENSYKQGLSSPIKKISYLYNYQVRDSLTVHKSFSNYASDNYYYIGNYTASNSILRYFNHVSNITSEVFFAGNNVKTEDFLTYNEARLTSRKTVSGEDVDEEYYRNASDKNIQKLISANILDQTIEIEKKKNGKSVFKQEVKYENSLSLLPTSELNYNIQTGLPYTNVLYEKYDTKGNLLQYRNSDGIPVSLIWGYFDNYPMVKVEGITYDNLMSQVFGWTSNPEANDAPSFVVQSFAPISDSSQNSILNALDNFRKNDYLKNHRITTYTYNPLIGVTSITPPSGIREVYVYDAANRLKEIRENNAAGKILKEFQYHYKH